MDRSVNTRVHEVRVSQAYQEHDAVAPAAAFVGEGRPHIRTGQLGGRLGQTGDEEGQEAEETEDHADVVSPRGPSEDCDVLS